MGAEPTASRAVLVTGAAAGLGRVVCERFAALGDRVHICDVDASQLRTVAAALPGVRHTVADVGRREDVEQLIEAAVSWMGRIDVLVNNVGIAGPHAPVERTADEAWLEVLGANLMGAVRCIRSVLGGMKSRGRGAIVNVSTTSVVTRPLERAPYVVSKAALESLTMCVAREAGPYGVRCNTVRPGMMDNARLRRVVARVAESTHRSESDIIAEQLKFISMRTMVSMDEVASAIVFLASDEARHISGQTIAVDGDFAWEI
jgi:NAD(P)-dependent dehydrogenase (short-subunit alcohol dehydrogenase family)